MIQNPSEFGATFKRFMDQMAAQAPAEQPFFFTKISGHLNANPRSLPAVAETFPAFEHPNLQLALDHLRDQAGYSYEMMGVAAPHRGYLAIRLSDLVAEPSPYRGGAIAEGPMQYKNITLGDGRVLPCIENGLLLISQGEDRIACLVAEGGHMARGAINVEAMATDQKSSERFLAELRKAMRKHNAYRGRVVSLSYSHEKGIEVHFHNLRPTKRDDIILPPKVLELVERQTIRFSERSEKLAAAGRHLKRGVLLHGPPGTGKTLTAMYLAQEMKGRTVLLVTGRAQGLIEQVCWMARVLEPATVILEDVDLIARDREDNDGCSTSLLFELLNQMDGLASDSDILFLLTTNRPDLLEPALASRPGRVDMAIEIPLPDDNCRTRLMRLYGTGLQLQEGEIANVVRRTQGASAAFVRELLRRSALIAADDGDEIRVGARHLDEALQELVLAGGPLTRNLLGFTGGPPPEDD
jgi:hypothetical protein